MSSTESSSNGGGLWIGARVRRFLSPMSNAVFQRVSGAVSRVLVPIPLRSVCELNSGKVCKEVPSGVLEALLRLASLPTARAEAPPIPKPQHLLKEGGATEGKKSQRKLRHPAVDRVVAIGDVHGDVGALRQVLSKAGVLGSDGGWSGGKSVLVQVGDQLDRGDGERQVYDVLFRLQDEAPKSGGAVHILLGNHELMNATLDFRYVTAGGFADFFRMKRPRLPDHAALRAAIRALPPQMRARARAIVPGGPLAAQLASRAQVAVIVGDNVFVHAGLTPAHLGAKAFDSLHALNKATSDFLRGHAPLPPMLAGGDGPVWNRTYSRRGVRNGGPECRMLNDTLRRLRARRMVVGHTVQPGVNSACGARVWRIDTGMSAAYGGAPEAIEIGRRGQVVVHTPRGVVSGKSRSF